MNPLDLLVRESVQNSLDAAVDAAVNVDFRFGELDAADVLSCLGESQVTKRMAGRGLSRRFLEIRDTGTSGLTGPTSLKELALTPGSDHGNILKLIYEIGRARADTTAGGAWGLGKTVYYRVGCGLTLFYSRIREGKGYAERLAACLVEDEREADRFQDESATGVGWWGAKGGGPITDTPTVRKLLSKLGIAPFGENETGTAVFIPFLRNDLRPSGDAPWSSNDADFIRVALQRWYCIRLDNEHFASGAKLTARVDGRPVKRFDMLPLFKVTQALYLRAIGRTGPDLLTLVAPTANAQVEPVVGVRTVVAAKSVGTLAAVRLTPSDLKMTPPDNNPHPALAALGLVPDGGAPLVAFIRRHGMIIRWDHRTDAKGWSKGVSIEEDKHAVALFVPTQTALHEQLLRDLKWKEGTLDAYLRSCEMADHHQWTDPAGITVVSRIRSKVSDILRSYLTPVAPTMTTSPLLAARELADRLLPRGFGSDGRHGPPAAEETPSGPTKLAKSSDFAFTVTNLEFE
ncbi:MAG: hypothetical protein JNM17_01135, partial [Archangium sp.]|nr:hypothetical protein [Archangium sp.]